MLRTDLVISFLLLYDWRIIVINGLSDEVIVSLFNSCSLLHISIYFSVFIKFSLVSLKLSFGTKSLYNGGLNCSSSLSSIGLTCPKYLHVKFLSFIYNILWLNICWKVGKSIY